MKPKNVKKRLEANVAAWENLKGDKVAPNKMRTTKASGGIFEFTKPGSLKQKQ